MLSLKKVQNKDRDLLWNINQKYLYEMTNFYDDPMDENGNYHYGYFDEYFRIRREKHISFAMMVSLWDLQCSAHTQILGRILISQWLSSRYFRHSEEGIWLLMRQK